MAAEPCPGVKQAPPEAMKDDEAELVIRIGRGLNGNAPDILREFVIRPCPHNANASMPLEIQLERRPLNSGVMFTTPSIPWGDG